MHQGKISSVSDLLPLLEKVIGAGKSLFIIAEDVEGEALSTLVVNKIRGTFTSVAVKAPAFGDRRKAMLQDIATLTGAQVVTPDVGLKLDQVGLEVLGTARRVVVTKDDTTIIDGGGDKAEVDGRVKQIKAEIELSDSDWDTREAPGAARQAGRRRLRHPGRRGHRGRAQGEEAPHRGRRLGDPRGHRGGHRRRRRRGPRPRRRGPRRRPRPHRRRGGRRARRPHVRPQPLRVDRPNGGESGEVVVAKVRESGQGYNAATGEYGDLVAQGVLDPVKVTRSALANAASITAMLLTTETLVVEKPRGGRRRRAPVTATGTATEPYPRTSGAFPRSLEKRHRPREASRGR